MTPQEKAKNLLSRHSLTILSKIGHALPMSDVKEIAKGAMLIDVDEILNYQNQLLKNYKVELKNTYWEEVKTEIEKL